MSFLQHSETDLIVTHSSRRDCLHCGTALTGSQEKFCCLGCAVVYNHVEELSLLKYYDTMKIMGAQPDRKTDFDTTKKFAGFDEPHVRQLFEIEPGHFVFQLPEIKCVGCMWIVENVLNKNQNIDRVQVNLLEKNAHIWVNKPETKISEIAEELHAIGYDPHPRFAGDDHKSKKQRIIALGLSGLFFANVMMFSAALYFGEASGMNSTFKSLFPWMSAGIASIALAFPGRSFIQNSIRSIQHRTLHIDLPITIALLVTYGVSVFNLMNGIEKTYFDSITGLIFLLLVGRTLDHSLQERALAELRRALPLLPEDALLYRPGQEIECKAGDIIPADGLVVRGSTEVNEAVLTGESIPVLKHVGSSVFAGTQNLLSAFCFVVEKSASETVIARLGELIEKARSKKSASEQLLSRVLPWFLTFLTVVAVGGFLFWLPSGLHTALEVFWTVLIVVCPCTLALSAPLSTALALSRLQKQKVLVKSGESLERIGEIDTIICDKTGTLTEGKPKLVSAKVRLSREVFADLVTRVRLAADASRHPLSQAIARDVEKMISRAQIDSFQSAIDKPPSEPPLWIESVDEKPGFGLEVRFKQADSTFRARLGQPEWVLALCHESSMYFSVVSVRIQNSTIPSSEVFFAEMNERSNELISFVTFELQDALLQETRDAVARWQRHGLQVFIASGDNVKVTQSVACELGLPPENAHGGLTPEDKLNLLNRLNAQGRKVMMIGDGLNDSACLSGAHVGVAVHGAVDLALNCSDVYLKTSGLKSVDQLIQFARYSQQSLKIALAVSASYNFIALILALSHQLHPLVAALIMPMTSLSCFLILALRGGNHIWKS